MTMYQTSAAFADVRSQEGWVRVRVLKQRKTHMVQKRKPSFVKFSSLILIGELLRKIHLFQNLIIY